MNKEANGRAPVERRVMRKPPNKWFAVALMSAAAKSGGAGAIRLAAQLAGAEPCERCGFVWNHCKCEHNAEANKPER